MHFKAKRNTLNSILEKQDFKATCFLKRLSRAMHRRMCAWEVGRQKMNRALNRATLFFSSSLSHGCASTDTELFSRQECLNMP